MSEHIGAGVNAPELVRAGDKLSFGVPALHPSDAVVEAEETDLDGPAAGVFDHAIPLAHLVVGG